MNVTKTVACKILKALGFKADVSKWDLKKLTEKLNDLPKRAGIEDKRLPDDELNDILHDILADLSTGKKVKVEEDDEVEVPFDEDEEPEDKPAKKGKKSGKKPKAEDNGVEDKPAKKDKGKKGLSNKATVYKLWAKSKDKSTGKADEYAEAVEGRVKTTTIRAWISSWNHGRNLPGIAKQVAVEANHAEPEGTEDKPAKKGKKKPKAKATAE